MWHRKHEGVQRHKGIQATVYEGDGDDMHVLM